MLKDKKTPEIRFKGFTEDWEQRKFGEMADYKKGPFGSALKKEIFVPKSKDSVKVYEQQNAINKDWKLERYFITKEYANKLRNFETHSGDIIISCAGTIGEIYELPLFSEPGIINQALMRVRVDEKQINKDMYKIVFSNMIDDFSKEHSNGSAMKNIPPFADLKPMEVLIPKSSEQKEITDLFNNLDNLITLHQRKCDKLLNFKKSMLEKMFPKNSSNFPEIRFKGFTDAWEQRKWIDMVNISTEMVDPKSGKYDNLPHIGPGNIESFTGQFYDNIKKVGEENLISGKFHFYPEDIIYGKINPQLGKYVFPLFEGLSSADSYVLNAKNGLNQKYLYTLLQTTDFYKYSVSVSMRSGMPKINRDELNAYEFSMPKGNEQQQIGALFLEIDNLITLHQRKLEKLKNIKTSMLNKMFI